MGTRRNTGKFPPLPARQLGLVVDLISVRRGGRDITAKAFGTSERTIRDWLNGRAECVRFDLADTVLTRLGLMWWDVWNEETVRLTALMVRRYERRTVLRKEVRCHVGTTWYGDLGLDEAALSRVEYAFTGERREGEQLELGGVAA